MSTHKYHFFSNRPEWLYIIYSSLCSVVLRIISNLIGIRGIWFKIKKEEEEEDEKKILIYETNKLFYN